MGASFEKPIAKNAITILINLSADEEVLASLAEDDTFIETLLVKLTVSYRADAAIHREADNLLTRARRTSKSQMQMMSPCYLPTSQNQTR